MKEGDTDGTSRNRILGTVEWKFSERWSDNEKLSTQLSISAREKPKRRRLLFSKARRKRRGVFFFSRRQSDVNNLVGG